MLYITQTNRWIKLHKILKFVFYDDDNVDGDDHDDDDDGDCAEDDYSRIPIPQNSRIK